jgi:two-component system, OmpR family, phosphate regulon sensor histidine kinase PhoR
VVQAVRDHRIVEVFRQCQQSGQEESAVLELEDNRFLRIIVTPFIKRSHRGHVVILQDLTRLHHLQTVRQDFISNISHELRTPLAALRALVDTLNDGAIDDPPAAQRFLHRMEVEVDAMTQMVQELLELAHIESGHAPLRLQELPAAGVIAAGAERLRPQAERAELTYTIDLAADLPSVIVDPDRIQQVVTNLVHNAIKFTRAGGQITVTAHHDAPRGEVIVQVCDTGVGIAPEDCARIFERFYKADRARASGGTGLGLAIAKHVVQAHSGRIWAESSIGKGSTFCFSLPTTLRQPPSAKATELLTTKKPLNGTT